MANGEEKAVWEDASKRERDAGHRYVYGPTWGVAMVELAIKIYGQPFKNTASSIDFKKPECVPIITKVLSLLPTNQLKNQIDNLQVPVAEVLIEAVKRGYTELVDDLLKRRDEGEVGEEEKMLFHYALPHEPVFSRLYDTYASSSDDIITIQDKFGRNVLHLAAKGDFNSRVVDRLFGRFPLAEKLILSKDQQRRTPLHIAASKGNTRIINKILQDHFGTADSPEKINYIQATDSSGRTALQIAASEGHDELVRMLMDQGSCPLRERDGQKKTALHHAAQVKILRAALATCKALLEHDRLSSSKCSLLLWASATGIGTADEMEHVHEDVKRYLRKKKGEYREPLLEAAAINNEVEMAWELLSRGADFAGIHDLSNRLQSPEKESVEKVLRQMEHIKEQGRDQPSMEDKLGRYVFAQALAALFLNRFIESPITVGISGEWGMGKSSLMIQTEKILLITAAQLTFPNLLPPENFDGAKGISLSRRGRKTFQQINRGAHNLLGLAKNKSKRQKPLVTLLEEYQPRYHDIYKALACMDRNQMLQSSSVSQHGKEHVLREVPRILTIRYNAWHYRDRHEAWAGLGVAISKEIEKAMTRAQWMSTCWRYTCAKEKVKIWYQLILPCLLIIFVDVLVPWTVWMQLGEKFQGLKYGSIPFTIIPSVWGILKSFYSVVKPVSTQMVDYVRASDLDNVRAPDHTSHLGYQEAVISDINFLKKELGKQPYPFFSFILGLWCWNWFGLYADNVENTSIPKCMPASEHEIRIVTFVDDLDRCEEKVILQVLSAINLVLAECKINVILGMDKKMIERAIMRNFGDESGVLAEKFISKIIQIPLILPELTDQESNRFLEYHLRHKNPAEDIEKRSFTKSQSCLVELPAGEPQNDDGLKRGCREMIEKAVHWSKGISNKLRRPHNESLHLSRSAEGVRLIREILLPNYTTEEADVFYKLMSFATENQRLPREWKRLLSYHKFAWYVLSLIGNVYSLPTWKKELVAWVFVCWQWKHEMNHLIKVWNRIANEQKSGTDEQRSDSPSLGKLVWRTIQVANSDTSGVKEQGISQMNWPKLQEALYKQDVSMEGIQLFQQFRLHCEIDHLPCCL
ncbi:uncharacterized protein LOC131046448 [Cryptomeria japonica]|uniref:uncharacterized protein LOC131046448 n=1 Tax=Cryptomeria japonica TaxID=3369 RepID=UPI0027D9D737|nr:uncharacterized protein LOC131046448 [Cryptomeria japonica]